MTLDQDIQNARTSTSSQKLARTFDTLIESPEAEINAIPVFRPESFPAGNNGDIPVSVQELVYGGKAAGVGTACKKNRGTSEGLETPFLKGTSPTDKRLVEKPQHDVREPEEEVGPRKGQQPVEAPQASTSKNLAKQVPNKKKKTPKSNKKGKLNAKGK
ncbi:hypothetical protein O181_109732 [Austropuccinia psidii MF-1]|uniref:Uncharacterized protein n=1 Tax=Austropuccinia psidii MF-1 TaxID=1389203 RepID=A0A9Q3JYF2_9BASI|nr:hypothetical protein [Austropuccinia psidii MF-1]